MTLLAEVDLAVVATLRDSEWSHGCRRDAVTVCLQYLVPQVTASDVSTIFLKRLQSIQNMSSLMAGPGSLSRWAQPDLSAAAGTAGGVIFG